MSSAAGPPAAPPVTVQTFSVRLPRDVKTTKKKYSILKFNANNNVDFSKCGWAKIERENNLKEFKSAYDIDAMPKFGAGSEYGRDQREEARKKKFGVRIRKYNSDDQPWLLKFGGGSGTQPRRFKGTREGGITENASYYIFMQCSDGKAFEAYPVEEWYNFMPQIKYKYLDSEEAEQEFSRRDKTLNYFSIMLRKRLKNSDGTEEPGEGEENEKGKKSARSLLISEFDEMSHSSDDDADSSDNDGKDDEEKPKKKQKVKAKKEKQAFKKKKNDEDGEEEEAVEESDEMDEGEEVDYMSGSSSDDEMMYDDKARDESEKYQDKGVEDEEGLRKIVESGDEDEEEEEKKEEDNEEEEENRMKDGKEKDNSASESSSDSDSDSDLEKDSNFASPLFMQEKRQPTKQESSSRPSTPANTTSSDAVKKRKAENQSPVTVSKKAKNEASSTAQTPASTSITTTPLPASGSDGITEEAVRRYLMRKPMTTKELVQKFKSRNAGMTKEQMTMTIAQILKRLNPLQKKINGVMTLYLTAKPTTK